MKFLLTMFGVACVIIAVAAIMSGQVHGIALAIPGIISLGVIFN